tara:strand:- start:282 stop:875 length:594 start_codon:yes stop_codon:yes gene_type:complete
MTLIFYDFETTGLNPYHDNIIEYSFNNAFTKTHIQSLVKVNEKLSDKVVEITSITDDMLSDKPSIDKKKDEIFNFITNNGTNNSIYLVAHNNDHFDKLFFKRIFHGDKEKIEFINTHVYFIDSLLLARFSLPKMRSVSLKTLCKIFSITEGTHRSLSDTIALMDVYKELLRVISRKLPISYESLYINPIMVYNILYN